MVTVFIFIIIGLLIGILITKLNDSWYSDLSDYWFGGSMGIFIGLAIGLFVSLSIGYSQPKTQVITSTGIASLQDVNTVKGKFFLGSGTIDGKQVFSYYEEVGENQYKLQQQPAELSTVIEDGGTYVAFVSNVTKDSIWYLSPSITQPDVYFHVPKASVLNEFTLDSK